MKKMAYNYKYQVFLIVEKFRLILKLAKLMLFYFFFIFAKQKNLVKILKIYRLNMFFFLLTIFNLNKTFSR